MCLPEAHLLSRKVQKAAKKYVKKHWSPLHELMHTYNLKPDKMEKIKPILNGPKWEPAFAISSPPNKEQAIDEFNTNTADAQVFTDGLCIKGQVGAAAVLYRQGVEKQAVRLHLRTQEEHTVFEAEVAGAAMGAKLLQQDRGMSFTIGLDSLVAIHTTRKETMIPGQYLVDMLHRQIEGTLSSQVEKTTRM